MARRAGVRDLQGGRRAEHKQHERVRVAPGVVADRLDGVEQEPWPRAVRVECPQPLRRVGLDAHYRKPFAVWKWGRGVLALARRVEADADPALDIVAIDIGLAVLTDRRIEESAPVRQEERLVVVSRPGGDVHRRPDADAPVIDAQIGEIDVGRGWWRGDRLQCEQCMPEHVLTYPELSFLACPPPQTR